MAIADVVQRADMFFHQISGYLNSVVIALVILLLGFILGRIMDRLLFKLFLRTHYDDYCFKLFGRRLNYARATRRAIVYLIYIFTVYVALRRLNAEDIAITFVLIVFVVIVMVSAILALIEVIPNLMALGQLRRRKIKEGDQVEVKGESGKLTGKIVKMTITDVHIQRRNGDVIYYPNAALMNVKLTKKRPKK